MSKNVFIRKTVLHAPVSTVFSWHTRDGAIHRLTPPWVPLLRVAKRGRGIDNGVEVTFRIKIFGVPMTWQARHIGYRENEMFRDCQVKGPFADWEHTHLFYEESPRSTVMEDQVRFRLPFGIFSRLLDGYAQRQLDRLFLYRHQVLKYDMETRAGQMVPRRILVSGSSGTIGKALVSCLKACGHEVIRLVRDPRIHHRNGRSNEKPDETPGDLVYWDPYNNILDMDAVGPVDAVINLNGVDITQGRWSRKRRAQIMDSRIKSTQVLVEKMTGMAHPPSTFISASAIGFYGDGADRILTEENGPEDCFISRVCREWEAASRGAEQAGIQTVQLRTGVVLTPAGGALKRMYLPFLMGLGARLSHGRQYLSWIGLEDVLGGIFHILANREISGPVNLTAPEPVTHGQFTRTLAGVLGRRAPFVIPRTLALALWGDMGRETLLASTRVMPGKLIESGYRFVHPGLEAALGHVLGRPYSKNGAKHSDGTLK